jgi:hypothetical protein
MKAKYAFFLPRPRIKKFVPQFGTVKDIGIDREK